MPEAAWRVGIAWPSYKWLLSTLLWLAVLACGRWIAYV